MAELTTVPGSCPALGSHQSCCFCKREAFSHPSGKRIAAIVPIDDIDLLEAPEDKIDIEEARTSLAEARKKGTVSWEKLKKDLRL